jgi:hypothetical protein
MSLFDTLLIAHLLGDWILQTEWQAQNKERGWGALLGHVVVYHLFVLGGCLLYLDAENPIVYVVVILLAVSHLILDRRHVTIKLMSVLHRQRNGPAEQWLVVAFDQAVHITLLGVAAWVLTRGV